MIRVCLVNLQISFSNKMICEMVYSSFFWQFYELTNLVELNDSYIKLVQELKAGHQELKLKASTE